MTHKLGIFAAVVVATLALSVASAYASTTYDVGMGNTNIKIGTATYTRTLQGDGSETLGVSIDVTGSGRHLTAVHVCVAATAFTSRTSPGQCAFGFDPVSGTTFSRSLDLGTSHVGSPVCIQNHVGVAADTDATVVDTAYAAWHSGSPFYGTFCLTPAGTDQPIGAYGAIALTGLIGVGFAVLLVTGRRRSGVRAG